jgi:hypothetical protein
MSVTIVRSIMRRPGLLRSVHGMAAKIESRFHESFSFTKSLGFWPIAQDCNILIEKATFHPIPLPIPGGAQEEMEIVVT